MLFQFQENLIKRFNSVYIIFFAGMPSVEGCSQYAIKNIAYHVHRENNEVKDSP